MKINVGMTQGNVTLIGLAGRLDSVGTPLAEADFHAATSAGRNVVVDLSGVTFITSVGIRLLVDGARAQTRLGGKLILAGPDDVTRKVLKTTGVDQLVPICADLAAALAAFGPAGPAP